MTKTVRRRWLGRSARAAVALVASTAVLVAGCTTDDEDPSGGQAGTAEEGNDDDGDDDGGADAGDTLAEVQARDELICGVNDTVPGFGIVDNDEYVGFDIDFCKAVAAAVLGDPDKVDYRPLTTENRLLALQAGEVDVLIRNTTWTASRDGTDGATFVTTNFYDGVGMMVASDSGFETIEDLDGAEICVLSGTTTEQVLDAVFVERGIDYNPQSFESNELLQPNFESGACDGWVSDKSQLAGVRSAWPEGPDALTVMEETLSKEPLGPAVSDGDDQWASIVDWTVIATIQAEESGITSDNVEQMLDSDDPAVRLLLGVTEEGDPFDPGLGLEPDWAVNVISAVGNYGEIYDRHLGPDTALGLERGVNALWTEGGLMYAPPYR